MIQLGTILVPHDFSRHSDAALGRAVALARLSQARIHLLHSYAWPVRGVMPYDLAMPAGVWDSIREGTLEKLEQIRSDVEKHGIEARAEVSSLLPLEAITTTAEQLHADLVVLGTRGLTGLQHVVLGSIAERTVRLAPCPVLTVKEDDPGGPIRRILVATDFSKTAEHAQAVAAGLARQIGAELVLAHAFDVPLQVATPYDVTIPDSLIRDAREAARRKLAAAVEAVRAQGLKVNGHLSEVPAASAIAESAAELGADLIVIGTRGHTGLKHVLLGSVAERTLRLAQCPVLAVKPESHQLDAA